MVARQRLRGVHLRHRHAEADGLDSRCSRCTMRMLRRGFLPALAVAVDVPASAHQHVRGENGAAGEIDQQPLAARFDAIDVWPVSGVSSWKRVSSG